MRLPRTERFPLWEARPSLLRPLPDLGFDDPGAGVMPVGRDFGALVLILRRVNEEAPVRYALAQRKGTF